MSGQSYDIAAVKAGLPFLDLMAKEGIVLRKSGANWVGSCPFHAERSASFTVHGPKFDHGHCYGCSWNGDVLKYWQERYSVDFSTALAACAELARVRPEVREGWRRDLGGKESGVSSQGSEKAESPRERPSLPRMRYLEPEEVEQLAALRGLRVEAVQFAASVKRVGWCLWPQFERCAVHGAGCKMDKDGCRRSGEWDVMRNAAPCWVVTDAARRVAQFRRLDGKKFEKREGKPIKSWTKGSPTWPVGAGEMSSAGSRKMGVVLVEGGPDILAAYHFLIQFGMLGKADVVGMLGSSNKIAAEALPLFAGRRVRIFAHDDDYRPVPGRPELPPRSAGWLAALRWQEQLTEAGAAVETFSFAGLWKGKAVGPFCRHREPVADLNDLVEVDEAAWLEPELREAFCDWDF